jgi:hypothetical protein
MPKDYSRFEVPEVSDKARYAGPDDDIKELKKQFNMLNSIYLETEKRVIELEKRLYELEKENLCSVIPVSV